MKRVLVAVLSLLLAAPAAAEDVPARVRELAWLAGTWRAPVGRDATREESWTVPDGGTMLGSGREIRGGDTSEFEFLALRDSAESGVAYDAYVGGAAAVTFLLTEGGGTSAVFTNEAHDFPTRIAYTLADDDRLQVDVSGPDGRGFSFTFTRIGAARSTPLARIPDLRDLWDWGDAKGSEQSFRSLLPRAEAAGDAGFVLEVRTQVARALGLQARFDEAHAVLDDVEAALEAADHPRARLRYLLERGRALRSSGHPDEARPFFEEAWTRGRESGDDGPAVDAAHMVALVAGDEALEWNQRALALAESSPRDAARRWRASLYNNIGWTHHDAGRFEEALAVFEKAVPLRLEQGKTGPRRVAEWAVARSLRSLDRTEEALAVQERLHAEWNADGGSDGYVEEEIAECLHALGRAAEARSWFERAHASLSADPWMVKNEGPRLARLAELAAATSD